MKRKKEEEDGQRKEVKQRSVCDAYGGDGVAWFRGGMIGQGSFGSVYLANSKKPNSKYGCFPPLMAVKSAEVSVSGTIQKEREVLSNIGMHPNIIGCFGEEITTGENGEMVYNLLLEYGSGGTLADLIEKAGGCGLPESHVKRYARSILLGLNHIHGRGYVHCDLKPGNILLVPKSCGFGGTEFKPKIGDFGLAKRAKQSNNKKRKVDPFYWRGTPMYLSPEVVVDNVQEPPSDIWAFGCIVLEMITGKPPWVGKGDLDGEELLRLIGQGHESPKIPDELSKDMRQFLKGCFSRKTMFRLTADMLLNHSFVEGLVDDFDVVEEEDGYLDADEIDSSFMLYETDDECSDSSLSGDCSFVSEEELFLSSWFEEGHEIDNDGLSSFGEEEILEVQESADIAGSTVDDLVDTSKQVPNNTMQQRAIGFTIPAGG
ncbi:mitogen-activated protein kinase kinase kinase 20-like [Rhododendron vialii]|uniref:mitogen-activated protein kinase kinase kinase 20-like n=1 Tax=Rhododendron vialii TaxID=182163 RepID=UPI00265F65A8|nr:mitogen-activated protein kinase kinase kinase 20-like [Rhododendron vialii]XP_058226606.1 mitogen-activated protein kinase kinase kinase 20-like [Rhododendron vialii]